MSYGYQGPPPTPYMEQYPPTSFGVPPGTPSAPTDYNNPPLGFNQVPTSFGMPQPHFSSPYPMQPGMPLPQSGHIDNFSPYPTQPTQIPTNHMPSPAVHMPGVPINMSNPPSFHTPMYNPIAHPFTPYNNASVTPDLPNINMPTQNSYSHKVYPSISQNTPQSSFYDGYSKGGNYAGGQGVAAYGSNTYKHNQSTPKLSPTVVPYSNFNPAEDAEGLRKAMKGFGTDEKTIIQILANRTNEQRLHIANQFKTLYGKDLISNLKSELSGKFEDLIVAMMTPLPEYYADELHNALSRIGTKESVLIDILCTLSNHEIRIIKQVYQNKFGNDLEKDLRSDTSGNFERLMVSLCCANRDESFHVDVEAARNDARRLLQAGELRFGTDESTFNAILVQRNAAQLKQTFAEYQNITGHDIEQAIENEFSGDIKEGLLAIVKCIKDRPTYFAERLYNSMKGAGTKDKQLIRLVITRSEVDMREIKDAFLRNYNQTLENFISDDCSGDYKKCLLQLIA